MRTGTFFQLARGRAIVRKNAMRRARTIKGWLATLDNFNLRIRMEIASECPNPREIAELHLSMTVRKARSANREWRHYRQLSKELD